ncbi:hypothetical protein [Falsiroseomonas sp. HW251]|uniref:hypothetical protein n=1 Tax=Falsiroseomonas sp. HW251 TaxID=3390998 RepID=UPI003D312A21
MPRMRIVGGDRNHGRPSRAIGALAGAALAGLLLLALPRAALAQATPEGNPLVQRDVPAEATAENAVVARDRALVAGQRIAYQRMAVQLGLPQNVSDSQVEAMVSSLVIESERVTARGYAARITVNFRQPGSARAPMLAPDGAPPVGGGASPSSSTIVAVASYRSFGEYAALVRGLSHSRAIARAEVISISGDRARIRLGLRRDAGEAASELAEQGVLLLPSVSDAEPREWRLSVGSR